MKINYEQRLRPVIRHLEQHYTEAFNLEGMAALAHLSPYHFHRIFKAVTNETPSDYLRRLRLENIARCLFYDPQVKITFLALDHGFSSSQALAKAFRQYFGMTPSAISACSDLDTLIATMRKSKIGHTLRNQGHVTTNGTGYTEMASFGSSVTRRETMHIEQHPSRTLAYIRVTGPYGENYKPAHNRLCQWAQTHQLDDSECLYIYWDYPEITADNKCRTDLCFVVPSDTSTHGEVEKQSISGGSYAVIRRIVTDPVQYEQFWQELTHDIVAKGIVINNERPCFELYHSYDDNVGEADVSFSIPVEL